MKPVVVYGTGGHAKVILDILTDQGRTVAAVLDDNEALWGKPFRQITVDGGFDELKKFPDHDIIIAVGNNQARRQIALGIGTLNYHFTSAIHSSAQISDSVNVDVGTSIMSNVAVNADTTIGQHAILNTGCTVDHDCVIGDFVHLSPGVHLAGNVRIDSGSHLGVGISVVPGVSIGEGSIIGAGAAVIGDIPPHCTAVGVPAKVIKQHSEAIA
jgi:sugar O-acyltransferase (sialic acid O-acetyltransferase NeuD family)